jgi:predicted amidohydrolase
VPTVALLHLDPRPGNVAGNLRLIEAGVLSASRMGAKLIVAPELAVSGYGFRDLIGTDWIARDQAAHFAWAADLACRAEAGLVLGMPEASPDGDKLFNSLMLFASDGRCLGRHRKINVLRIGSESWSVPGDQATVVALEGIGRVGLFVCADMYSQRLVQDTAARDVDLLVSGAAWAPGEHGPAGEWEWASVAAGRPVLVCNRTGVDVLDFRAARSVVAVAGSVISSYASPVPAIILVDWIAEKHGLANWRAVAAGQ